MDFCPERTKTYITAQAVSYCHKAVLRKASFSFLVRFFFLIQDKKKK